MTRAAPRSGHANRGRWWERALADRLTEYERAGRACGFRTSADVRAVRDRAATGGFRVLFTAGGPPDFCVAASGVSFLVEAKSATGRWWPLDKLPDHQADRMDRWEAALGPAGCGLVLLALRTDPVRVRAWALLWRDLRPVWVRWRHGAGRAAAGTAKLTPDQLDALGMPVPASGDWLGPVLDDLAAAPEPGPRAVGGYSPPGR